MCVYVCVYVCMYVCMYIYIYIYDSADGDEELFLIGGPLPETNYLFLGAASQTCRHSGSHESITVAKITLNSAIMPKLVSLCIYIVTAHGHTFVIQWVSTMPSGTTQCARFFVFARPHPSGTSTGGRRAPSDPKADFGRPGEKQGGPPRWSASRARCGFLGA